MIILGLLLLIAAVAFGIDVAWKNDFRIADPVAFGQHLGVHNAATLFVVGAITGALALLGISLLVAGMRHKRTKAVSRRRTRHEERGIHKERDELRVENADLHNELDSERVGSADRDVETSSRQ
jgi:hypothetical protein